MTKKPQSAPGAPSKKQLSRKEQETRQLRLLYILGAITIALVLSVLGYGYYQEYIAKPAAPIAIVNGTPISTRDYQTMVRYARLQLNTSISQVQAQLQQLDPTVEGQEFLIQYFQQSLEQLQTQASSLPQQTISDMIDNELIRQEAAKRGIQVTSEELQQEIEVQFGFERNPPTPTPTPITATETITVTPTPTTAPMTEDEYQKSYDEYVAAVRKNAGLSEAAFRRLFESSLYRSKLQTALEAEVPTSGEQVHARHILVATEDEAKKVVERLKAGEDFAALAKELSTDTSNKDDGGDLGWFARGTMVTEFEDAAFALQPGEISDPVSTSYGYHVIQMVERDANRAWDESTLSDKKSAALEDWLTTQRQSDGVQSFWTSAAVPPSE